MTSAAEHAFGKGEPLTVGVEEEYMLLDATTFELVSRFDEVADAARRRAARRPRASGADAEHARGGLGRLPQRRRAAHRPRDASGAASRRPSSRSACGSPGAGAHPFSRSEDQRITTRDRYRWLVEQLQYVARRELVFGMHVHVAVPDPDLAMHVMESLLAELPVLLALSASSPFWRGEPTGLASTRTAIFASMPRSGQPPRFTSYDDYLEMVATMEEAGVIDDYTYLWWDVRPHPRLGTVEIRVMDVQFDIDQTLMLAAYVQASVARAIDEVAPRPPADRATTASSCPRTNGRRALRARCAADGSRRATRARGCPPPSWLAAASSDWRRSRASSAAPTRWRRSSARSRGATARRA